MKIIDKVIDFRHDLNAHPEPSMQEVETRRRIREFLEANTQNLKIVEKDRWLYAFHDEGADETYLFRADFDAILHEDGSSFHGCGHDGHTAILAGLAATLDGEKLGRNIVFLFQHAEETGEGAFETVEVFDEVKIDKSFALHGFSGKKFGQFYFRPGIGFCASTGMKVKLKGVQSHASQPEDGNNPAYLMAELTSLVEPLSQFNGFAPMSWNGHDFENLVMATVVYQRLGEVAFGVSPSTAEMGMTLRAYHEAEMDKLISHVEDFVAEEATKRGLEHSFEYLERFPETRNDPELVEKVIPFMDKHGFDYQIDEEPLRSSEDFGHIAKHAPACYFILGLGEDLPPMHNVAFEFPDAALSKGLELFEKIAREGIE